MNIFFHKNTHIVYIYTHVCMCIYHGHGNLACIQIGHTLRWSLNYWPKSWLNACDGPKPQEHGRPVRSFWEAISLLPPSLPGEAVMKLFLIFSQELMMLETFSLTPQDTATDYKTPLPQARIGFSVKEVLSLILQSYGHSCLGVTHPG